MKLIMENWRRWMGLKKEKDDFPADGTKPIDPSVYNVHAGGAETNLQDLNPSTKPVGASIQNRPTVMIDPPENEEGGWDFRTALDTIEKEIPKLFLKSDRDFQEPGTSPGPGDDKNRVATMVAEIEDKLDNIDNWLANTDTITPDAAALERERIGEFRKILGHVDTGDIDLYHIGKRLRQTEEEISEMLKNKKWY